MNKKNLIIQIYAYLVAFSAVLCLSITTGIAIYSVIGITSPETTVSAWKWEPVRSFERFKKSKEGCAADKKVLPDDAMLQKMYEDERRLVLIEERRTSVQTLIYTSIIAAVSAVLLIIHWNLGKRLRKEDA